MKQRKPRTAYQLLARVRDHIAEEPRRYFQGDYIVDDKDRLREIGLRPPCGTAACRAGWIILLHDGPEAKRESMYRRTQEILGMSIDQLAPLVAGSACDYESGLAPVKCPEYLDQVEVLPPTDPEYIRRGVRGLETFMKQHEKHLKSRLLAHVPCFVSLT